MPLHSTKHAVRYENIVRYKPRLTLSAGLDDPGRVATWSPTRSTCTSTKHTCCLCQTATQLVHILPRLQPKVDCAPTAPSQSTGIQQLALFHLLNAPTAHSLPHFSDRHGKRTTAGTAGRGISGCATSRKIHSFKSKATI